MNEVYATLCYDGETVETELTMADCRDYATIGSATGGPFEHINKSCHFAPYEPGAMAGEIMPVDANHPANAVLKWMWPNEEYAARIKAAFSVKEFPAGVL